MPDRPQPLTTHLEELRIRILITLAFFLSFSGAAYLVVDPVLNWLAEPVGEFIFMAPTDAFYIRLKIAFGLGAVLAFPVFLFHSWRFIQLGLLPKEKKIVFFVVPFSCFLFYVGVAVVLFGVAPLAMKFLLSFQTETLRPYISVQSYLSFLLWMILGFGTLFQIPLVIVVLANAGVVKAKQLSRYRRHVVVGLLILAAFLTPGPDVVSQLVLMIPTYLLFELSLLVAAQFSKKKK